MLNSNESKKTNKKKKKKRNEISLEEYEEENHTRIYLGFKFEEDNQTIEKYPTKSNYLRYQSNIINDKKNEAININNNINRKDSEIEDALYKSNKNINVELKNQTSGSTNTSSFDEDNKKNSSNEKIKNIIKNAIHENRNYKISSAINNAKILDSYKSNNNYNNYNYNPFIINNNFNRNENFNYLINNNNFNYNNILFFNYNNYNNFNNCKYIITYNYYLYTDKLKNNKKELNDVENKIKILEKKTLSQLFIEHQFQEIFNYIKKKKENGIKENNTNQIKIIKDDDNKETLQHPYFYINHDEEIQIKNVLYLIEGLFLEDNLKKDYNLLKMLNRDGYASIKQLEKHPLINLCKVTEIHLKTVFSEHRGNEVTETVETFDDILIRNRNWNKIKKEINNMETIEETTLNHDKIEKDLEMKKLFEKKENYINKQKEILDKYMKKNMNIRNKMNELNFNNLYNNNFNNYNNYNNYNNFNNVYNNNIFNNNMYNNNLSYNWYNHKRY